ncbi:MAG: CDGSH-type Zn-finger protein [Myxococcota bacterium]|jgi:CDGSH-type Zn-finger protein
MSEINVFVIPDGPLKVSNPGSVTFCGEPLDVEGDVYFCRCGKSTNAPFCDGTHKKVGFSGACEERPGKAVATWEGQTLRTFFNPNTCMHVFYCKPLKALREQEQAGDAAAAEEIIRVIGLCPSGALSYELKADIEAPDTTPSGPAVEVMEGGEIRLKGTFAINEPLLERQSGDRATLCRCGMSKNKPWCDGRHKGLKEFR